MRKHRFPPSIPCTILALRGTPPRSRPPCHPQTPTRPPMALPTTRTAGAEVKRVRIFPWHPPSRLHCPARLRANVTRAALEPAESLDKRPGAGEAAERFHLFPDPPKKSPLLPRPPSSLQQKYFRLFCLGVALRFSSDLCTLAAPDALGVPAPSFPPLLTPQAASLGSKESAPRGLFQHGTAFSSRQTRQQKFPAPSSNPLTRLKPAPSNPFPGAAPSESRTQSAGPGGRRGLHQPRGPYTHPPIRPAGSRDGFSPEKRPTRPARA